MNLGSKTPPPSTVAVTVAAVVIADAGTAEEGACGAKDKVDGPKEKGDSAKDKGFKDKGQKPASKSKSQIYGANLLGFAQLGQLPDLRARSRNGGC